MARDRTLARQGGLPPIDGACGAVVEIACDESGFSGTNLLDPATPVFTHASVDLAVDEAEELIVALRSGFRYALDEVKSGRFLRGRHSAALLEWLLGALNGRAHVLIVDKEYFLVTRMVDLLTTEPSYGAGTRLTQAQRPAALALYRAGRSSGPHWNAFLAAFVELARAKRRDRLDRSAVERFLKARDSLARVGLADEARALLDGLDQARLWDVVSRLARNDRSIPPPLEPLLPALAETVLFWSDGRRRVLVIHDEQSALTAGRLRNLQEALIEVHSSSEAPRRAAETPAAKVSPLAGLVTVDSRDDARIQVADLLAGIARRSSDIGADDPLHPFVSPTSLRDPEQ